jgi:hypothetical protein
MAVARGIGAAMNGANGSRTPGDWSRDRIVGVAIRIVEVERAREITLVLSITAFPGNGVTFDSRTVSDKAPASAKSPEHLQKNNDAL